MAQQHTKIARMEPGTRTREDVRRMLRGRGITPTRQRVEIALALFARRQHLSADQVLTRVNRSTARTSKATIYNTLNLFLEKKLIRQVLVDPGRVFYDPNTSPHHHVYDVSTGELSDIDASHVRISGLPRLPRHVTREGVDVIIRVRSR